MRRRLVIAALAAALLAGCTSVSGTPSMEGADGSDGAAGTVTSSTSPVGPVDDPNADSETSDTPPTSTQLIAAALEAGEIDEPTSLLYRTWVYFGDPQLPERYFGEPTPHEQGLLTDVRDKLDGMPADIRGQIEPYLLRPANPASAFNATPDTAPESGEGGPPGLRGATTGALREGEPAGTARRCETGWDSMPVDGLNFRVWACRDAAALRGGSNAEAIAKVAAMLQKYVPRMAADMGELIPDDPSLQREKGADERIDVYVMPTGWLAPARGLDWFFGWLGEATGGVKPKSAPSFARTVESQPNVGVATSSYILVSSDHFSDMPLLEQMVVHELFHAFQNALNQTVQAQWWNEGSAEWAASYYVRSDSARLHKARLPVRQNSIFSLLTGREVEDLAPYGAYLWPLFMEQQIGAKSVFNAWKGLASLPAGAGDAAVINVINQQLDMAENFAEFTMRTFNAALDGDPIRPRFVDLDGHFPDGLLPQFPTLTLTKDPLEIGPLGIEGLGHSYFQVDVPGLDPAPPDSDVSITIRSDLATDSGIRPTLEALVRTNDGTYERHTIHYGGDGENVCVAGNLKLVLTNQATEKYDRATGSIYLERNYDENDAPQPCTRIEATDPAAFTSLADGDIVAVDGTENDGKPGVAPVIITVRDVKAEDITDYRIEVTLTGDTLNAPKKFDWALAEFEVLSPDKVYREAIDVTLDKDLTDKNRPLTIDARLVRDAVEVHAHEPTVELHGLKPCDPNDVDVTCELVGDLVFKFSGDYHYESPDSPEHHQADLAGMLSVRLGEKEGLIYPDAGSTWKMSGSASFERCIRIITGGCEKNVVVEQDFADGASGASGSGASGPQDGVRVSVKAQVSGLFLNVNVPVLQTTTVQGPDEMFTGNVDEVEQTKWVLGCPVVPDGAGQTNSEFWKDYGTKASYFDPVERVEDPFPTWSDASLDWDDTGTELIFDCSRQWATFGSGSGSMSYELNGTLRWVQVD